METEKTPGAELVAQGRCPMDQTKSYACIPCPFGHLKLCHHPKTCAEAGCAPKDVTA